MTRKKMSPQALRTGHIKKPNSFIYRLVSNQRFLAIIGLVFLLIIIIPLAKAYSQHRVIENEIAEVEREIIVFENKNQELKELINYLQSEQSLEEQARLNLNLKKPGEQVIVIEDKDNGIEDKLAIAIRSDMNNFRKWWSYFFN